MKRYRITYRNKKNEYIDAYSYELKGDKYIFYKTEDKSDSESFAFSKDVMAINVMEEPGLPSSRDL